MSLLRVQGLACTKKDRQLFEDLNFSVETGQLWHIRGPNGAGKTSLLRILVGLTDTDVGEISYLGKTIADVRHQFYADLIYFGHKLGINPILNALENLHFWCAQHGAQSDRLSIMSLLAKLGLVGLEDLPCGQLSAGQQRRVALARFWLKPHAKLWILDEPFTALDVHAIKILKAHLQQHIANDGAIIMTSHQPLQLPGVNELTLEYLI